MRTAEAHGAIDVLRNRLSQLTGVAAEKIDTVSDSIPAFAEVRQEDDLASKANKSQPHRVGRPKPRAGRKTSGPAENTVAVAFD